MFQNKKYGKMKKLIAVCAAVVLVLSLSASAFADNQPGNNGGMGGFGGRQNNFSANSPAGNMNSNGGNMNSPMSGNGNAQQPDNGGSFSGKNMDSSREDMTPPDDADAQPGEDVPEKPDDREDKLNGIDMRAVLAYIENAGDNADAAVASAYTALPEALAADPEEAGEEDNLASLESALTEALAAAEIDLSEYAQDPEMPENSNQPGVPTGRGEQEPMTAPENRPEEASGIDMRAVEAYIENAGDNADAAVASAYTALSEALAADPEEAGEEDDLASLESALTEALAAAEVDLSEYAQNPELPENGGEGQPEGSSEEVSGLIALLQKDLNRILNYFNSHS